ncbi:hypothetical protein B4168_4095 [Anoxybacillus flavithermus]|nr:hypothetical protein B4168_4095 [Anoxybacillus flavithermus]OAO88334.1 hypothetical protein GT23_0427 [Parageobacillus thermoglucosidasius]
MILLLQPFIIFLPSITLSLLAIHHHDNIYGRKAGTTWKTIINI